MTQDILNLIEIVYLFIVKLILWSLQSLKSL